MHFSNVAGFFRYPLVSPKNAMDSVMPPPSFKDWWYKDDHVIKCQNFFFLKISPELLREHGFIGPWESKWISLGIFKKFGQLSI